MVRDLERYSPTREDKVLVISVIYKCNLVDHGCKTEHRPAEGYLREPDEWFQATGTCDFVVMVAVSVTYSCYHNLATTHLSLIRI